MLRRPTLLLLWTLFVLYPDPRLLGVSALRALNPPIDPEAVRGLAASLPSNSRAIEAQVNGPLVAYKVPWQTHRVPWYYPTPREVLASKTGDCQARAILLASLLRAKGIPARLVGSFDHLWVDYPGKRANQLENKRVAIVAQQPDGQYRFRWPALIEWRKSWQLERAYFWDPMPAGRLWLLLGGWLLIATRAVPRLRRLALDALASSTAARGAHSEA
jgi:hypothetical protein